MPEEIGTTTGEIWKTLDANDELSIPNLKEQIEAMSSVFDWALGWLAREDKIVITRHQRSYSVRLSDSQARTVGA